MIDTRAMRFETLRYAWDPDNPLSGKDVQRESALARESESTPESTVQTFTWPG